MVIDFAQHVRGLDGEIIQDDTGFARYVKRVAAVRKEQGIDADAAEAIVRRTEPKLYAGRLLTLGACAINALLFPLKDDEGADGVGKMERWKLAASIHRNLTDPDDASLLLPAEAVALLKDRIGKYYHPVVVGPAYGLLEAPATASADDADVTDDGEQE